MAEFNNITDFSSLKNGDTVAYSYTGSVVTLELPPNAYRLKCYGAQGGNGGQGGYAEGLLDLRHPATIFIRVGGAGSTSGSAGWNGGGRLYTGSNSGGGGGASDIRICEDSLFARIIVAGGGGGRGHSTSKGGDGGGIEGAYGQGSGNYGEAGGGTQTSGGAKSSSNQYQSTSGTFGNGGQGYGNTGGAGGGGWYGGGGAIHGGGAGGSGYVLTADSVKPDGYLLGSEYYLTESVLTQGGRSGDGLIVVEVVEIGAKKFLVRDADGIKAWNGESWTQTGGAVSEALFLEHGTDMLPPSLEGLCDGAELLLWTDRKNITDNPHNFNLKLNAEVSPPTQTITRTVPFDMPPNAIIDYVSLVANTQNDGAVSYEYTVTEDGVCFVYTLKKPDSDAVSGIKKINIYFAEV